MKNIFRHAVTLAMLVLPFFLKAAEVDYTHYIKNADCSAIDGWGLMQENVTNGILRLDTWSGRGGSDGSGMTTPFLEYWVSQPSTLSDNSIMHEMIEGLPAGSYRLSMLVRLYNENTQTNGQDLTGASLVVFTNVGQYETPVDDGTGRPYNGQPMECGTYSIDFTVDDSGWFIFALVVDNANFSWIAFKNVKLIRFEDEEPTTPETGVAPPALKAGTYYIRNHSTGKYLCAGGKWGTQTVLGDHALPITVSSVGGDEFQFDAGFVNGDLHNIGYSSGSNESYCEQSAYNWRVQPNTTGYYNIVTQDGQMMGYSGSAFASVSTNSMNASCQWEFVTKQQMLNELLEGSHNDATFLIKNPRMDRGYVNSAWSEGAYGGEQTNYCIERWNTNFDSNQTISNIPNGRYRLTVQGYYRYDLTGNNYNYSPYYYQVRLGWTHDQYEQYLRAELYANEVSSHIRSIADEYNTTQNMGFGSTSTNAKNMPNSMSDASQCFTNGLYAPNSYGDNVVEVDVTDHTLTLGVRLQNHSGCDWTVWDNFELTLLSLGDNSDYDTSGSLGDLSAASFDNPIDVSKILEDRQPRAWKWYTTVHESHTINELPNGLYRLKLHGFYSYGDVVYQQEYSYDYGNQECVNNKVYAMYTIPYAIIMEKQGQYKPYTRLVANGHEVGFPSIFSDAHTSYTHSGDKETELGYIPYYESNGAMEAFDAGEYEMELLVPVTDGTLTYGVEKTSGYKNDLAAWNNYSLEYLGTDRMVWAEGITTPHTEIYMTSGEKRQLEANVLPENVTENKVLWHSDNSCVSVNSQTGVVTANYDGTANVFATAFGGNNENPSVSIQITVSSSQGSQADLVINEIQVANIDQTLDPSMNYGGFIELYNPTEMGIRTNSMRLSIDGGMVSYSIPDQMIPAKGYGLIWFDHNSALSSQIDNKLSMEGGHIILYGMYGNVIAEQEYPAAISRTSYGRTTDGGIFWGITATPTPGKSNQVGQYLDANSYARLEEPEVSHTSQVFTSPFTLSVDIPAGATLHYTLDGSTPTLSSGMVSMDGRFDISKTTVLRLMLSQSGYLPSAVRTLSFIERDKDYTLPVLSVVSNPDNFYNDTIGVFVPGVSGISGSGVNLPCNWNRDWERPVAFNYFTLDGKVDYSQEADMERCGGWSRSWFPYSFKLKASSQYEGRSFIEQQIFPDKPYLKQKAWQVRNGGNDLLCRIKDASLQHLITSCGWHLDCQDYSPTHVFVNGNYLGMMNIREPNNKHFGYANYGLDTDAMDAMELAGGITVKEGNADAFNQLLSLSSSSSNWNQVCELLDVDEFANYMAAQLYLGGDDWPGNNCKAFKGEDGKFHFVFFDVDQALRYDAYAMTHVNNNSGCPHIRLFFNLMSSSSQFRQRFIDAYCIASGSVFEPERVRQQITAMAQEMEHALSLEGLEPWSTANNTIRVLASETRQETMIRALSRLNYFSYSDVSAYDACRIKLLTNLPEVRLALSTQGIPTNVYNGYLFPNQRITSVAPMGYNFLGWVDENGVTVSTDDYIIPTDFEGKTLTATYSQPSDGERLTAFSLPIKVNEVSAANFVQINEYGKKNDWIELYNNTDEDLDVAGLYLSDDLSQPLKYQIPESATTPTIIPARGHLIVWADKLEPVSQLHTSFKLSNTDGCWVTVTSSPEFVSRNASFFAKHSALRSFADGLTYVSHRGDQSVGRYPDGGLSFFKMNRTTVERPNMYVPSDEFTGFDNGIMEQPDMFALDLAKGWNWVSLPMAESVGVDLFDNRVQSIRGQHKSAYNDELMGMTGTLTSLSAESMYKMKATSSVCYDMGGEMASVWSFPIELKTGWNWIGYPVNGAQTLRAALSRLSAHEGDMLVSQDGFSTYHSGSWSGTLSTLETGKGYMYFSNGENSFYYSEPKAAMSVRVRRNVQHHAADASSYDRYAYPNVMPIIAQVEMGGTMVEAESFRVEAFSATADGMGMESRGVGQYVGDKLFLTLHGQGGEPIIFKLTDEIGQSIMVDQNLCFSSNCIGTMLEPYIISVDGEATSVLGQTADALGVVDVQYFSLTGQRLIRPAGICIERRTMTDGSTNSRVRIIK